MFLRSEHKTQGINTNSIEWCEYWKQLDFEYGTKRTSNLHHDNRCTFCRKAKRGRR